jgi:MFS family permease
MDDASAEPLQPAPKPALFLILYLPFGIGGGYFAVTLGYLLAQAGVSTASIAVLVSITTWLQVFKIVWAPVADTVLTYRGLYRIACLTMAASLAATGLVPASNAALPLLCALAVLTGAAIGLIGVTTNGLMARTCLPGQRGRAAGWSAAGNLGGTGLGGGLGLWIATHAAAPWLGAAVLAALSVCAIFALPFVPEPDHDHRGPSVVHTLRNLAIEVWRMVRSRTGALAVLVLILPLGTGAAGNLFSAVAQDWRASANLVALVTGGLSGLLSGVGCLLGGRLCDLIDRKAAYVLAGLLMAACTLAMVALPKTPTIFVVTTLAYALITGVVYAGTYAVMLEAAASRAAATKCDLLISLCNMPIASMTVIDGAVQTHLGSDGMLITESAIGLAAAALYLAIAALTRRDPAVRIRSAPA